MDHGYQIGLLRPSQVVTVAHLLKEFDLSPVVPLYRKIVRVGVDRRREQRTFQVLPGVIFIYSDHAPTVQGLLAPLRVRVGWMREPTTGEVAICQAWQIQPLFDWARKQGREAEDRRPLPVERERLHEGQSVGIKEGPLGGRKGFLLRGATEETHVLVQMADGGYRVEVPRELVTTAKTPCAP